MEFLPSKIKDFIISLKSHSHPAIFYYLNGYYEHEGCSFNYSFQSAVESKIAHTDCKLLVKSTLRRKFYVTLLFFISDSKVDIKQGIT